MKASPVKVAKSWIIDGCDARVGTECGRGGLLLVTGGYRNAGCNFGAVCGKKSKQSHAQRIDGIRVDAGQNRSLKKTRLFSTLGSYYFRVGSI